jgi:hypothetical protein
MPTPLNPKFIAATNVVPQPTKGSKTTFSFGSLSDKQASTNSIE